MQTHGKKAQAELHLHADLLVYEELLEFATEAGQSKRLLTNNSATE